MLVETQNGQCTLEQAAHDYVTAKGLKLRPDDIPNYERHLLKEGKVWIGSVLVRRALPNFTGALWR